MMKYSLVILLIVLAKACSKMTNKTVENVPKHPVTIAYIGGFHRLTDIEKYPLI